MQESIEYKLFPIQETDGVEYPNPHQQGKLPYKARKDRRLILTSWQRLKVTLLLRTYAFFTKT